MQISFVILVQHFYGKSKSEESNSSQQPSNPPKVPKRWSHLWRLLEEFQIPANLWFRADRLTLLLLVVGRDILFTETNSRPILVLCCCTGSQGNNHCSFFVSGVTA